MAYQIDFTAANYASRSRRKWFLRLLLLAAIGGAAWGVCDVYRTYNQPTLNMKLSEYEAVARPIEEIDAAWDQAAKEYNALQRYYRLIWAASPTNFLATMAASGAPRLGRGFQPRSWTLKTGGECRLDYRYAFNPGDKAAQSRGLAAALVHSVTAIVQVVEGKVDVQGVQLENLLGVEELNLTTKFALPDVKAFPAKEKALAGCVEEIGALRKKVQESKLAKGSDLKGVPATAKAIMMAYLALGKDKPDFPDLANVIDVWGWFGRADAFIAKNRIPGDDGERRRLKESWKKVGDARFPWDRFRLLDNDELVANTKILEQVSDGVKRFKGFLDQRRAGCRKKLEPFVESYDHDRVFNEPLIEADLRDRFAKAAGILRASATFLDEPNAEPALLETADNKFIFTWVRWTLKLGGERGMGGRSSLPAAEGAGPSPSAAEEMGPSPSAASPDAPITLEMLADCARRVLRQPGPGYALDTVKIDFDANGNVSGAVLEGLLPVKKVEDLKPEAGKSRAGGLK